MVNDPRYTIADPRYTISALHILPSHTFEYRAREQWKKELLTRAALLEPIHIQCKIVALDLKNTLVVSDNCEDYFW